MALVMIRCPQNGSLVSTGIDTDTSTFERLPDASAHLHCPLCSQVHVWRKADAMLVDPPSGPAGPPKS